MSVFLCGIDQRGLQPPESLIMPAFANAAATKSGAVCDLGVTRLASAPRLVASRRMPRPHSRRRRHPQHAARRCKQRGLRRW